MLTIPLGYSVRDVCIERNDKVIGAQQGKQGCVLALQHAAIFRKFWNCFLESALQAVGHENLGVSAPKHPTGSPTIFEQKNHLKIHPKHEVHLQHSFLKKQQEFSSDLYGSEFFGKFVLKDRICILKAKPDYETKSASGSEILQRSTGQFMSEQATTQATDDKKLSHASSNLALRFTTPI